MCFKNCAILNWTALKDVVKRFVLKMCPKRWVLLSILTLDKILTLINPISKIKMWLSHIVIPLPLPLPT